jgi:nitroreductase
MHLLNEIITRRSYRSFDSKIPSETEIELIFEAARLAPSSSNAQPWKYHYAVRNTDGFDSILSALAEGNKIWALNAGALIVATAAKYLSNGNIYKHAWHDVGLANAQLSLQAEHLGLFTHIMGGFSTEKLAQNLHIETEFEDVVCVIALGYHGDGSDLNETMKARETASRSRKPLHEMIFKLD